MKHLNLQTNKLIFYIVSIIEFILYITFLSIDIFRINIDTTYIKYVSIIVLFLFSFISFKKWDLRHVTFRIAYLFTLLADLFLLVLNESYLLGVCFFFFAQLFYFIYLNLNSSKKRIIELIIIYFLIVIIAFVLVVVLLKPFDILYAAVIFYFALLITNTISCFLARKENGILLFIGFFLFILCDINVGLNNMNFIYDNNVLLYLISISMWLFYLPSQVIIVNSLDKLYRKGE